MLKTIIKGNYQLDAIDYNKLLLTLPEFGCDRLNIVFENLNIGKTLLTTNWILGIITNFYLLCRTLVSDNYLLFKTIEFVINI